MKAWVMNDLVPNGDQDVEDDVFAKHKVLELELIIMAPLLLLRRSSATVVMQHCYHYNCNHTVQHAMRTVAALSTSAGSSFVLLSSSFFFLLKLPFFSLQPQLQPSPLLGSMKLGSKCSPNH